MTPNPPLLRSRILGLAALAGPMLALGAIGGVLPFAIALVGSALAAGLRWVPRLGAGAAAGGPAVVAVVLVAVLVPATVLDGILAAVAGLGLLLWLGSDGRTMATLSDRLAGLALPGFAAFLALATSLAARGTPPSFGIAVAGAILLGVLVAAAALIARPVASPGVPPSS